MQKARAAARALHMRDSLAREACSIRSGDLLEGAGDAFLDRLDGLGRDLLGQRGELLALRAESVELLAYMRGRKFDGLRQRLHGHELGRKIERGVAVGARHLDHLETVVGGTLARGGVA